MMKVLPLFAMLVLWALPAIGSDFPPFGETHSDLPFFAMQQTEQPERKVDVYPNPVTEGRLTIKSDESFRTVQILNITGEIVFNQEYPSGTNTEVIELDRLVKGIYLVRIGFTDKTKHTEKIMIK